MPNPSDFNPFPTFDPQPTSGAALALADMLAGCSLCESLGVDANRNACTLCTTLAASPLDCSFCEDPATVTNTDNTGADPVPACAPCDQRLTRKGW